MWMISELSISNINRSAINIYLKSITTNNTNTTFFNGLIISWQTRFISNKCFIFTKRICNSLRVLNFNFFTIVILYSFISESNSVTIKIHLLHTNTIFPLICLYSSFISLNRHRQWYRWYSIFGVKYNISVITCI